ncbi:MAG TPA: glucose-1-phosphate adenylyltransferase family protein [Thermomicrobiales bacterium]|nr:glucose-1-phosphate adenylyltransferase family protein [Thermomicrobiales bacterium]
MARERVLALVLAGGTGSRMEVLTRHRAKPALPYAGVYRLIDLSLSNLRNSGMSDVWLVVQYETQSITEAVAGGRPWDLDRTHGGLRILPPQQEGGSDEGVWHEGNADAIYQHRHLIRAHDPSVLLVLSADHVYRMDFNDLLRQHRASGAGVTLVSTVVPLDQASNHGTITASTDGKVTSFAYKPETPESPVVATEIFAYDPKLAMETLERLARETPASDGKRSGLEDFGHQFLPELVAAGQVHQYRLPGYWKDVGRPETYFQSHMDLLDPSIQLNLDDPDWPIFTLDPQRMPARFGNTGRLRNSLVSPGCVITGKVEHSVLAPGVVVEEGATVRDAIILQDTVIRTGATVQFAIVDQGVTIGKDATVGQKPKGDQPTTEELVLVGMGARVKGGTTVRRGDRIAPKGSAIAIGHNR